MSFQRPTLQQIIDRARADIKAELSIKTILRRSFLSAFARALAGAAHSLHGHLLFISKQVFPDQAEVEFLERWGSIFKLPRKEASFAKLNIDIVFTGASTVTVGALYSRPDGVEYALDTAVTATAAGTLPGIITAVEAGDAGNLDDGETVSLVSPVSGVDTDALVASTEIEGEDVETDLAYRARLIDRIQNPPSGGTIKDYEQYALSVAGITRAWVSPSLLGEGTVVVYIVDDNNDPIFPGPAKIAEVQETINEFKPVGADVTVVAPIEKVLNINVKIKPDTADIRAAITAEIEDLIAREAQVAGSSKSVTEVYSGKIPISKIREAISIAVGEDDHLVVSPTADVTALTGQLITLGTITYSELFS